MVSGISVGFIILNPPRLSHRFSPLHLPKKSIANNSLSASVCVSFQLLYSDFTAYGLLREQTELQAYQVASRRITTEHQRLIRSGAIKE